MMTIQLNASFAAHPGAWIRAEIVEPQGLSVTEVAAEMHVTYEVLSKLLHGQARLSTEMATRFEKAFGVSANTLIRMQASHELAERRSQIAQIE